MRVQLLALRHSWLEINVTFQTVLEASLSMQLICIFSNVSHVKLSSFLSPERISQSQIKSKVSVLTWHSSSFHFNIKKIFCLFVFYYYYISLLLLQVFPSLTSPVLNSCWMSYSYKDKLVYPSLVSADSGLPGLLFYV